jgi:hypothetical protein
MIVYGETNEKGREQMQHCNSLMAGENDVLCEKEGKEASKILTRFVLNAVGRTTLLLDCMCLLVNPGLIFQ